MTRVLTPDGEPVATGWGVCALGELVSSLCARPDASAVGPVIVAVDGRSGSGKSTFAERLGACVDGAVVVHTDDVAWWESFFDWDELLIDGVLDPASRGEAVRFRPPAWERRSREGAIEVPAGATVLVVEGVGASRRSLVPFLHTSVWVQSDVGEARRRGLDRDGGTAEAEAFWDEWSREEVPFLAEDRPWERARFVVCGTPQLVDIAHDPDTEVLVARTPHGGSLG